MLCLTRNFGQRVLIDGRIWVHAKPMKGDRVKLIFDAPAEVPILREEVVPSRHTDALKQEHALKQAQLDEDCGGRYELGASPSETGGSV